MRVGEFRSHAYNQSIMGTQPIAFPSRNRHLMIEDEYLLDVLEMTSCEFIGINDAISAHII